jgi:hypothetical protein
VKLDLTQQWVQELVERELRLGRVEAVHMGPPCGTASKARNIPIRKKLRRAGAPNPQPLRSSKFPEGFPWLKGIRKAKVASANVLYEFAAKIANICDQCQCGILFTIENPQNSLIWETFFFAPLFERFNLHVVDACEYGSMHKRAQHFWPISLRLACKSVRCSGDHVHQDWKVQRMDNGEWKFDTAAEAEYPPKLAQKLAASFMDQLLPTGKFDIHDDIVDHAAKVGSVHQARRTRGPLLLSEFKTKVVIACSESDFPPDIIPADAPVPWQGVPVGSKLLDRQPIQCESGEDRRLSVTYGVYFSPHEFVEKALTLKHPFDVPLPLETANIAT